MPSSVENKKFTIAVEGNIGSGKSTLLSALAQSPSYEVFFEPVESWRNYEGHNLLDLFYNNTSRWAFLFEIHALSTLTKQHTQSTKALIKCLERSIHCTRYCFIENLHRKNILDAVEYRVLDDHFTMLTTNESCKIDLIIYLRTTPATCLKRIRARNRPEEILISLDDLNTLHERHEEWLTIPFSSDISRTPVLIIDADQDKDQVYAATETSVNKFVSDKDI